MARAGILEVEEEVIVSGGPVGKANDWGAIFGGALGAIAISIILFTAGSGFGISTAEPWTSVVRFSSSKPDVVAFPIWISNPTMTMISAATATRLR